MSKSLIQTSNQASQTVAVNGVIGLGSVLRRFGCNCKLNGNAISVNGDGYYTIDATATVLPTAAGIVTVALVSNGVQINGAVASTNVATAGAPVTLPINTTIRQMCCEVPQNLSLVLLSGAGSVDNVSVRVEKA